MKANKKMKAIISDCSYNFTAITSDYNHGNRQDNTENRVQVEMN